MAMSTLTSATCTSPTSSTLLLWLIGGRLFPGPRSRSTIVDRPVCHTAAGSLRCPQAPLFERHLQNDSPIADKTLDPDVQPGIPARATSDVAHPLTDACAGARATRSTISAIASKSRVPHRRRRSSPRASSTFLPRLLRKFWLVEPFALPSEGEWGRLGWRCGGDITASSFAATSIFARALAGAKS